MMNRSLSIALAQLNLLVGDIKGNTDRILRTLKQQRGHADLVMFSELALCGYPPEDLLFRADFNQLCITQLARLQKASVHTAILVGHPWKQGDQLYNALSFFSEGKLLGRYFKQLLPNHSVFDEKRYFTPGNTSCIVEFKGYRLGMLICEDIWSPDPVDALKNLGAEVLLSINASPYHREKPYIRNQLLINHCKRTNLPLVYLNQVGTQDELIFDGCSKAFNAQGDLIHRLAAFSEESLVFNLKELASQQIPKTAIDAAPLAQVYDALVMAVRDYVNKNGFKTAILGLSGGIDSALTLAIAVDALTAKNVQALMMPFRYTSEESINYARQQAQKQKIALKEIDIHPIFDAVMGQLAPFFAGRKKDTTEENLQARCRGMLLMAMANKFGHIVLTTGNKSELAVGYSTLYGDMAGGFDVLKDVSKTLVFKLAKYRNARDGVEVIPQAVIDRPPSAELAPNQTDQDQLPPYAVLDKILEGYLEKDESVADLVAQGCDEATVRKVIHLVDSNEHKRRQAAIGPRITCRDFGKDRRYPITNGFSHKDLAKD
ncbi:glutamine-dependent NAD(+) synthetase [Candidatus Regiella insecticola]|uniref:Glutamine-dependent NAD(+) synthetase n=2 Tax=Candidatus Regiella insecticola TaxID=138073 RepID=A0A6L2ZPF9_9ENTR|nr:glutamine-dependent NAD(+) synthetase [Candidatus Regiella insecticola]